MSYGLGCVTLASQSEIVAGGVTNVHDSRRLADALSGHGIYSALNEFAGRHPRRFGGCPPVQQEQYLMTRRSAHVVTHRAPDTAGDKEVAVAVPPLYHEVVTATLDVKPTRSALLDAQDRLEGALLKLESHFGGDWNTPNGLGVVVAWGLPYFTDFMSSLTSVSAEKLPVDLRATNDYGSKTLAILDALRFPSDPPSMILENNHVALVYVSDYPNNVLYGVNTLIHTGLINVTSIRKGFVGSNVFKSNQAEPSVVKQMALKAGLEGAEKIPDNAELFLGFTSTIQDSLGPGRICSFESLGATDQTKDSYFAHGTTMHLSHLDMEIDEWYLKYYTGFKDRITRMFGPARGSIPLNVPEGTVTIDPGGLHEDTDSSEQLLASTEDSPLSASKSVVQSQFDKFGVVGHTSAVQPLARLPRDITDPYGTTYRKGTPVPIRVDFDTVDNPFYYSSRPELDGTKPGYGAGLHFVVFVPTSDGFHRTRLAQDGRYNLLKPYAKPNAAGTAVNYQYDQPEYLESENVLKLNGNPVDPRSLGMGLNAVLKATHRQNFLVPPTSHRSFPLAELT